MHARRRILPALLTLGAAPAVGPGTALAKEGALAQLDATVPVDADPGSTVLVATVTGLAALAALVARILGRRGSSAARPA